MINDIAVYLTEHFDELFEKRLACPICHADATNLKPQAWATVGAKQQLAILSCPACTCRFKQYVPTTKLLALIYNSNYVHFAPATPATTASTSDSVAIHSRLNRIQQCKPGTKNLAVLDIGCGRGDMVAHYRQRGWQGFGIDPFTPQSMLASELGAYLVQAEIAQAKAHFAGESFDVATAWYVFEHLNDPVAVARHAYDMLKPGGSLLLLVPYADSWAANRYGGAWMETTLIEHIVFYTKTSLKRLAAEAGFTGPIAFRVAGRPFPIGKVEPTLQQQGIAHLAATTQQAVQPSQSRAVSQTFSHRVKSVVQQNLWANELLRWLIHSAQIGDYIEARITK